MASTGIESFPISRRHISKRHVPPLPDLYDKMTTGMDHFASLAGVIEVSAWAVTKQGRLFVQYYQLFDHSNPAVILGELKSPLTNLCKGIGISLIAVDVLADVHTSLYKEYSLGQVLLSAGLTLIKDVIAYRLSAYVGGTFGIWLSAKWGAVAGSWAGPIGVAAGAIAGLIIGIVINEVGNILIDWFVGLF